MFIFIPMKLAIFRVMQSLKSSGILFLMAITWSVVAPEALIAQVEPDSTASDSLTIPPPVADTLLTPPAEGIAVPDSLSFASDSLLADSLAADSVLLPEDLSLSRTQFVPLPAGIVLTLTDSADVGGEHLLAIEEYFSVELGAGDKKNLLAADLMNEEFVQSTAFVHGFPYIQARGLRAKEQYSELVYAYQELSDSLHSRFEKEVVVTVTARSRYPFITELDTSVVFDIALSSAGVSQKPAKIDLEPLRTKISGGYAWFERDVHLHFPRNRSGVDLLGQGEILLVLNLKRKFFAANMDKRQEYVFRLYPLLESIDEPAADLPANGGD